MRTQLYVRDEKDTISAYLWWYENRERQECWNIGWYLYNSHQHILYSIGTSYFNRTNKHSTHKAGRRKRKIRIVYGVFFLIGQKHTNKYTNTQKSNELPISASSPPLCAVSLFLRVCPNAYPTYLLLKCYQHWTHTEHTIYHTSVVY